jgi:hypothetical protein
MKKISLLMLIGITTHGTYAQVTLGKEKRQAFVNTLKQRKKDSTTTASLDEAFKQNALGDYRIKSRFVKPDGSIYTIAFFENDTTHSNFFQQNLVNYNPTSRQVAFYTEAIYDYLGPVRVGMGFQIKSANQTDSLSTADATQKAADKQDMLSNLQSGSNGDINVNVGFPLFWNKRDNALIKSRIWSYANLGFSLPTFFKTNKDFLLNADMGIQGILYAQGALDKLTFFTHFKAAYYFGNNAYQQLIKNVNPNDPTSFLMAKFSIGIDIAQGYRFSCDLYAGNSFVRNNFPATVSFTLRPNTKK